MPTQQNSLVWLAYGGADFSLMNSLIDQKVSCVSNQTVCVISPTGSWVDSF